MIKNIISFSYTWLFMIVVTVPGLAAFILQWFGLKKAMAVFAYKIAQFWAYNIKFVTGCRIEVKGKENIPKKGGVCFVSNHGSIFDIILALAFIGRPFGFVAKKELLFLPFINIWIYILGGLFIDRKSPKKAIRTINKGVDRLKKGSSILIFPEGHRSRGQGLLPFHPGSLKLAAMSGVPIVPISIKGSYDVFEKNNRIRAVPVSIVFGAPVNTTEFKKQELADHVRGLIEEGLK